MIILDTNTININIFEELCSSSPFFNFLRIYFLDLHCDYYEKYQEDIMQINENIQKYIKKAIYAYGNDTIDALQGIENFVYNLPNIISNYSFNELLLKRKKQANTAIIVSTGPSLIKQLPLLKQYTNYASIFCADSAYPILAKYNIKPDYVLSLERVIETSEFFNNNFEKFDNDIIFILKHMVHNNTFIHLIKKQLNIASIIGGGVHH